MSVKGGDLMCYKSGIIRDLRREPSAILHKWDFSYNAYIAYGIVSQSHLMSFCRGKIRLESLWGRNFKKTMFYYSTDF